MTMSSGTYSNPAKLIVVICCIALIIGMFSYAYFLSDANNEVLSKEEIQSNVEAYKNKDLSYDFTASYLKKYGIGNINYYKINLVEEYLETNFYKELPSKNERAITICNLFIENYYDSLDLGNKEAVTDAVINCYFNLLGDPYAYYRTAKQFEEYQSFIHEDETTVGVGIVINTQTLQILTVYKDSPAEKAGICEDDILYAVDGYTLDNCTKEELVNKLRGEEGTEVVITVLRDDTLLTTVAKRSAIIVRNVIYEMLEDNVGYIAISQFTGSTYEHFVEAVDYCTGKGAVALVIDVRSNPGGLLSLTSQVIDYLIPDAEDRVIATYTQSGTKYSYYTTDGHSVDVPIAVICNEGTASAGELFAAAIKDFDEAGIIDGIVVGKTTYGKGIAQTSIQLYDNSGITFTIGYFNPPSGVNFHGVGVSPDFEVVEIEEKDAPLSVATKELLKITNTNGNMAGSMSAAA